jgi:TatD DNase family protein
MRLFDTHAHLTDERFNDDREALIKSLPENGIALVMDIACDVREAEKTMALVERYPHVYAVVGMHPHEAAETELVHFDQIKAYAAREKVMAIGEIGLDYHYDFAPRDVQKKWFALQLELAQQLKLPVSLHIREAFGDCMDILRAHKNGLKGVMHCFSGSLETAFECLDLGLSIAFGGAITFENAKKISAVAARVPLESIVLETDCPYMTPVPFRGKRNDPTLLLHTAKKLAELQEKPLEKIAEATFQNGLRLFEMEYIAGDG